MLKLRPLGSNQTLLQVDDMDILFSYETPVAARIPGRGYIRTTTKWSNTTSRHISSWLGKYTTAEKVEQSVLDGLLIGVKA